MDRECRDVERMERRVRIKRAVGDGELAGIATLWNKRRGYIEVNVPGCGLYEFSASNGTGIGRAAGWALTVEDMRLVRNDPSFSCFQRVKGRKHTQTTKPAEPEQGNARQTELFR